MDLEKYNKIIAEFNRHAEVDYPLETCGIITRDFEYVRGKNISEEPMREFILDHKLLLEYDNNIWALCHSHPGDLSPSPSRGDFHGFIFRDYKFIVGNTKGIFIYWFDSNLKSTLYEPFELKHCQL